MKREVRSAKSNFVNKRKGTEVNYRKPLMKPAYVTVNLLLHSVGIVSEKVQSSTPMSIVSVLNSFFSSIGKTLADKTVATSITDERLTSLAGTFFSYYSYRKRSSFHISEYRLPNLEMQDLFKVSEF